MTLLAAAYTLNDVYTAAPIVEAPQVADRVNPLNDPFTFKDSSSWFTLYNLMPTCLVEYVEWDYGMKMANVETFGLEAWGDVAPTRPTHLPCPTKINPGAGKLFVVITVYYELQLTESIYWPRSREFRFQLRINSRGEPYWLEGYDLTNALGHVPVAPTDKSPHSEECRRHPRRPDNPEKGTCVSAPFRLHIPQHWLAR